MCKVIRMQTNEDVVKIFNYFYYNGINWSDGSEITLSKLEEIVPCWIYFSSNEGISYGRTNPGSFRSTKSYQIVPINTFIEKRSKRRCYAKTN